LWQGWLHAIEDAGVGVAAEIAETVAFVEELSRARGTRPLVVVRSASDERLLCIADRHLARGESFCRYRSAPAWRPGRASSPYPKQERC
jgi:hypothetical protein